MEKPWDLKDLVQRLKDGGLELTEEAAKHVILSVFGWSEASIRLSPSQWDDVVLAFLPLLQNMALAEAEKINPHD